MNNLSIRRRRRERHKNKFKIVSSTQNRIVFKANFGDINVKLTFSTIEKVEAGIEDLNKAAIRWAQKIGEGIASFINSGISERMLNPCVFNSGSEYLKCAVNPQGNCNKCPHYQKR